MVKLKRLFSRSDEIPSSVVEQILYLDQHYFPLGWTSKAWKDIFEPGQPYFFLLLLSEEKNLLIGQALFLGPPLENLFHLLKVLVHPDYRRKGFGELILQSSFAFLQELSKEGVYLEVHEENKEALALYKKLGFEQIHLAKNYYGAGKHAVKMVLYFPRMKGI